MMEDMIRERDKALKIARGFARSGNRRWAQIWLDRAGQFWIVSDRQIANLEKLLEEAEENPAPAFRMVEYTDGYAIEHIPTGQEAWTSDGVDMFHDEEGRALSPGTDEFDEAFIGWLREDEDAIYEAYFPHLIEEEA